MEFEYFDSGYNTEQALIDTDNASIYLYPLLDEETMLYTPCLEIVLDNSLLERQILEATNRVTNGYLYSSRYTHFSESTARTASEELYYALFESNDEFDYISPPQHPKFTFRTI